MTKEKKDQPTWKNQGLPDLRDVSREDSRALIDPAVLLCGDSEAAALLALAEALGLGDPAVSTVVFPTPAGEVAVHRAQLPHIVEKRQDARERYAHFAVATMLAPFEVWSVDYDDGSSRLAFIGLFRGARHMLVVVSRVNGLVLWNFMHSDRKALNKHRHGTLVFRA